MVIFYLLEQFNPKSNRLTPSLNYQQKNIRKERSKLVLAGYFDGRDFETINQLVCLVQYLIKGVEKGEKPILDFFKENELIIFPFINVGALYMKEKLFREKKYFYKEIVKNQDDKYKCLEHPSKNGVNLKENFLFSCPELLQKNDRISTEKYCHEEFYGEELAKENFSLLNFLKEESLNNKIIILGLFK